VVLNEILLTGDMITGVLKYMFGVEFSKERYNRYILCNALPIPPKRDKKSESEHHSLNPSIKFDLKFNYIGSTSSSNIPICTVNGNSHRLIKDVDKEKSYLLYGFSISHVDNPLPCRIKIALFVEYEDMFNRPTVEEEIVDGNYNDVLKWMPVSHQLSEKEIKEAFGKEVLFGRIRKEVYHPKKTNHTPASSTDIGVVVDGVLEYVNDHEDTIYYDKSDAVIFNGNSYIPFKLKVSKEYLDQLCNSETNVVDFNVYKVKNNPMKSIVTRGALQKITELYDRDYLRKIKLINPEKTRIQISLENERDIIVAQKYFEDNNSDSACITVQYSVDYFTVSNNEKDFAFDFPQ